MRKILSVILLSLVIVTGLSAEAFGFRSFGESAFLSPSYSDRFQDALMGAWQLPRVENDAIFYLTSILSEEWDLDELEHGGKLSWIQHGKSEVDASFVGKNLALTAFTSTYFTNRRPADDPVYDIYNTLAIQIDWGISFDWFSTGITMLGGSEMVRKDRAVTGWPHAMENAYFSSFSHAEGRDFFSLGLGAALDFGVFSASAAVKDIITLRDEDIYVGWDAIFDSMELSMAVRYPEFTKRGDLNLVRPRMSWTLTGNPFGGSFETSFRGEMQFQLLPELDLSFALGYTEKDHNWFDFDDRNGLFMTGFSVMGETFGVSVMLNTRTDDWRTFSPAVSFTWAR